MYPLKPCSCFSDGEVLIGMWNVFRSKALEVPLIFSFFFFLGKKQTVIQFHFNFYPFPSPPSISPSKTATNNHLCASLRSRAAEARASPDVWQKAPEVHCLCQRACVYVSVVICSELCSMCAWMCMEYHHKVWILALSPGIRVFHCPTSKASLWVFLYNTSWRYG